MGKYDALTVIKIIANAPCDDTYSDVRKFGSASEQASYFSGLAKYTYNNCSYQRVNSSVSGGRPPLTCRVPTVADNLYDCNYVMFQNSTFGSKWFYAFIRQVNYVSPECTEIVYEIDSYQTYQFNYTVKPSLVEREHPEEDILFANTVEEPFSNIPIVPNKSATITDYDYGSKAHCNVYSITDSTGLVSMFTLKDNIFTGYGTEKWDFTDISSAKTYLNGFATTDNMDKIATIVTTPFPLQTPYNKVTLENAMVQSLNGYSPKYKKCFNYPFNYLTVSDLDQNKIDYKYESFTTQSAGENGSVSVEVRTPKFWFELSTIYPASLGLFPMGYNGIEAGNVAWTNGFVKSDFPETAYGASVLSNAIFRTMVGMIGIAGFGAFSAVSGAASGAAAAQAAHPYAKPNGRIIPQAAKAGMEESVSSSIRATLPRAITYVLGSSAGESSVPRGTGQSQNFLFKNQVWKIVIQQMSMTYEYAKKVDDFFDMYGYATNIVKVPNEDSRESWNYVKTDNVIITGSMPVQDMAAIKAMYNRGVRFWHTDDVGNYSLRNSDVKEVNAND